MTKIVWSWADNSDNETGFQLCDSEGNVIIDAIPADTTSVEENITTVGTYIRKVRAYNDDGNSDFSNSASVVFAINTPTEFQAALDPLTGLITYSWIGNEDGATYQICDENGNAIIDNIAAGITAITEQLTTVGNYTRKIRCHAEVGYSDFSTEQTFDYNIPAPDSLAVTFDGLTAIYTWNNNALNNPGFKICDENGNVKAEAGPGITTVEEILPAGDNYTRKVKAFNDHGESAYSENISFYMGVVVSTVDVATAVPNYIMITPDETLNTGNIHYLASRDDGVTWTRCIKNMEQMISSQPADVNIRVMAVIFGDALLNGWSYSWR